MPYAVTLTLDPQSSAEVRRLWQAIDASGLAQSIAGLDYAPHVTLSRFADLDAITTADLIETFAAGLPALPVRIDRLATFENPSPVLFLGLVPDPALIAFHARLDGLLAKTLPSTTADPQTRSGQWIPHVTLTMALPSGPQRNELQMRVADAFTPFDARLVALDLVRFPPVTVLDTALLDGRHAAAKLH